MIRYQKKDNVNNTWAEKEIKRAIELADPDYIPRKVGFVERALEKIWSDSLKKDELLGYETACYLTALNVFREIESGEVGNTSFIRDDSHKDTILMEAETRATVESILGQLKESLRKGGIQ